MQRLLAGVVVCALVACSTDEPSAPRERPVTKKAAIAAHAVDVANGLVRVEDADLLDLTDTWTLEAWVYPRSAGNGVDQDFIMKWAGVTTAAYGFQVDATGVLRLVTNNGITQSIVLGTTGLTNNAWQHVGATYGHGTVRLYLNGVLDQTATGVLAPIQTPEPVGFGREAGCACGQFNGLLDDIRVWDRVRSGAAIARFRGKRLTGHKNGLVGYWRLDEGAGTEAADATGHGLTGVLQAGATWSTNAAPVR